MKLEGHRVAQEPVVSVRKKAFRIKSDLEREHRQSLLSRKVSVNHDRQQKLGAATGDYAEQLPDVKQPRYSLVTSAFASSRGSSVVSKITRTKIEQSLPDLRITNSP